MLILNKKNDDTYLVGPRNRRPGQHLIISDVKKGSVAHR